MKYQIIICLILAGACYSLFGCRKDFLQKKPDNALVVPASLKDLQALLDNDRFMNGSSVETSGGPNPALLVTGADEYYALDANYLNYSLYSKNIYIWDKEDPYGSIEFVADWSIPYRAVFYSNIVLSGLEKIDSNENYLGWQNAFGSALFFRAHAFYQLAQVFTPYYDVTTPPSPYGIPLRLSADINEKLQRATLQETYSRIYQDLKRAASLLPDLPLYKTRPSRSAAYALLARVYLATQDYDKAFFYADSCLQIYSGLLDYNTAANSASYPLFDNKEIIFKTMINISPSTELWTTSKARIDSLLYNSYQANDLRKSLFFKLREPGKFSFRGSYENNGFLFTGIAVDELYFIRAECLARKNNVIAAMSDLNKLLEKRWKTGTFIPLAASSSDDALNKILMERRKQLLMRGLRWTDLRRLNTDSRFAKTITRIINGQTVTLPPNDLRFTWPIPLDVLGYNPAMMQNPR